MGADTVRGGKGRRLGFCPPFYQKEYFNNWLYSGLTQEMRERESSLKAKVPNIATGARAVASGMRKGGWKGYNKRR